MTTFGSQTSMDEEGYILLENLIPDRLIDNLNAKLSELIPDRAVNYDFNYATDEGIKSLPHICVWWSKPVTDWPEVQEIHNILSEKVSQYLDNPVMYTSSVVTTNSGGKWGMPHVDAPHRFEKWKSDKRLLGVQCIIALQHTNKENGVTGLVPGSHKQDWEFDLPHSYHYNQYFLENCVQPDMSKGTALVYTCRLLHRGMPNNSPNSRPMLLITYLNGDIIEDVKNAKELEWEHHG